jgi:hypothetical protein
MNPRKLLQGLLVAAITATGCGKTTTCPVDETAVDDQCYALQTDPFNCGSKGNACAANQGCSAGNCVDCTTAGAACTSVIAVACFNLNEVRPLAANLAPSTAPILTDNGPISLAWLGGSLYVGNNATSDISPITLSPPSVGAAITISPNQYALEEINGNGNYLWASDSYENSVVIVDPTQTSPVQEVPLATSASDAPDPYGIAFVGAKAYVALNSDNALAVLDITTVPGVTVSKRIDLSALAGTGAAAMPSGVAASGTTVYVTLWELNATTYEPVPGVNGRLAVVDSATDTVVGEAVDLGSDCLDPSGMVIDGATLWVACGFYDSLSTKAISGAALLPVDISKTPPAVGTPITLSNAAISIVICNGQGFAGAMDSGTVIAFDPVAKKVTNTALACPSQPGKYSYVPAIVCASNPG